VGPKKADRRGSSDEKEDNKVESGPHGLTRLGSIWSAEFRVCVDIDGLSPACEMEPGAVEREQVCLEVSSKVTPELNILEAINTGGEEAGDADGASGDVEWLCHP